MNNVAEFGEITSFNGLLFFFDPYESIGIFQCYDPKTNQWMESATMEWKFRAFKLVQLYGALYAIVDPENGTIQVLRYNHTIDEWLTVNFTLCRIQNSKVL